MPEGPSLVILKELASDFAGKTIASAEGNTSVDKARLLGQTIVSVRSWGKHFLIELPEFTVRIHLLMFGSYRINERKPDATPRLALHFTDGQELNFYTCSVKYIEGALDDSYDWRADVMSDQWDPRLAMKKLAAMPGTLVCDALLDQTVFSGVGNIIKNEVLFRIRVHPLSTLGAMPQAKRRALVKEARDYSFQFLEWKKDFVLKQHWLVHTKSMCPRCEVLLSKGKLGLTKRRSFYCERCQVRYVGEAEA
ncbi:MAG: endonuclease [Rubrivivax sp.]|nr:MAG: endonuclease [Rubrivivax sp.]